MLSWLKRLVFKWIKDSQVKAHELNYLFWECTTRCQLNCLHCGSDGYADSAHRDMPAEDFLRALDTIPGAEPGDLEEASERNAIHGVPSARIH